MGRRIAAAGIIALALLATLVALLEVRGGNVEADINANRPLIGLWEGIDPVDGGDSLREFVPAEDGGLRLVGRDSVHTFCRKPGDPDDTGSDRGIITGNLSARGVSQGVATFEGTLRLTCYNPGAPAPLDFGVRYELDLALGMLSETLLDTQTGVPIGRPVIEFFQVDVRR